MIKNTIAQPLLAIIFIFLIPLKSMAEPIKNVKAAKTLATEAVTMINSNNINQAFDKLKQHWPLGHNEIDDLVQHTIQQRLVVAERFGDPVGIEFIESQTVGKSLVRFIYLEKFKYHALRWQISFYFNDQHWIVNSIYWDDKVSELYSR